MTDTHAVNLLSTLPPCEYIIHLWEAESGWYLRIVHRHPQGLFTDCPVTQLESLTLSEALDVICASVGLDEEPF